MTISVEAVRDSKCSHGVTCPRCKGTRVRWHGKDRLGQQRYRCTSPSCGKTFNDRTGTPLARTRLLGKWEAFARLCPTATPAERQGRLWALAREAFSPFIKLFSRLEIRSDRLDTVGQCGDHGAMSPQSQGTWGNEA